MKKVQETGKRWSEISKFLVGRTENSVKNRYNALIKIIRKLKFIPKSKILKEKEENQLLTELIELKASDKLIHEEQDSKHKPRKKAQKALEIIDEYHLYKKDILKSILGLGNFPMNPPIITSPINSNPLENHSFRMPSNFSPINSPIISSYDWGFNRMYAMSSGFDQMNLGYDPNIMKKVEEQLSLGSFKFDKKLPLPFNLNSNNTSFASFSPQDSPFGPHIKEFSLNFKVKQTTENLLSKGYQLAFVNILKGELFTFKGKMENLLPDSNNNSIIIEQSEGSIEIEDYQNNKNGDEIIEKDECEKDFKH